MCKYIYFIAQTGIIYDEKPMAPTLYYIFRFRAELRAQVEDIIERQGVFAPGIGWTYDQSDIDWMNANDKEMQQ